MSPTFAEFIVQRAISAVISMDEQGLVTAWNPSAEEMFGRSRDAVLGRPIAELIVPERWRAAHVDGLRRFLSTGEGQILDRRLEMTAMRADGTEFPIDFMISAL